MTTLEQKVDLIMRRIASDDLYDQDSLREEIIDILKEEDTIVSTPEYNSLDDTINSFLLELAIPPHLGGFQYIAYAIQLVVDDRDKYMSSVTKTLYPTVAKQFDTTAPKAERAIRLAIEVACNNGLSVRYKNLFANQINPDKGKPTNSAFIASCTMEIKRRRKEMRV
jgi:two-component system response regulator (stage 0 sporulation protein A)